MEGYIPDILEHPVVHFTQRYEWDCGLACILMVLGRNERRAFLENFKEICFDGDFGESTWTIDLCYILKDFNIHHKYFTTMFGANPLHSLKDYYKCYSVDVVRVNEKFDNAANYGVFIEQRSVSYRYLVEHLGFHGCIIMLVNASLLYCDMCKLNKFSCDIRSCLGITPTYMGHYIMLCGYNKRLQKFIYRNPACKDKVCYISFQGLDKARMASGTDEDLIFLYDKAT